MLASVDIIKFSQLKDQSSRLTDWDNFVAGVKNSPVMQSTRWAGYKQEAGWQSILLSRSTKNSLNAVCLVLHRSVAGLPIGGVLYAPRGPVLNYDSPEAPDLLSEILDSLVQLACRRFAVVRISPDVKRTTTWVEEILLEKGFYRARQPIQHTATLRLDLTHSLDEILAEIQPRRRTQIRKYEKDRGDWSFQHDNSAHALEMFYPLYHQTITAAGKDSKSSDDISLMHNWLAPHGSSAVFIVKYQNRPVAGAVIVAIGRRLWYLYGGSVKEDQTISGAGVVLHWEIIKWAKSQDYTEYDLQGMPEITGPDDPMYGIYRFKQAWGGEFVHLIGEYDYAPYPFLGKILEWKLPH